MNLGEHDPEAVCVGSISKPTNQLFHRGLDVLWFTECGNKGKQYPFTNREICAKIFFIIKFVKYTKKIRGNGVVYLSV